MKWLVLAGALLMGGARLAAAAESSSAATRAEPMVSEQMLREQKHFLECLVVVYHPAFWISHDGSLYFQPKNETQTRQLDAMKAARDGYAALNDRAARYALTAAALAESGVSESWRRKILLPFSNDNLNLTPTLAKPFRMLRHYTLLQTMPGGDALLQAGEEVCFVLDFAHASADSSGTNLCLVREGTKTYTTADGTKKTVEAFSNVGLSREETAVLVKASAGFRKKAEIVGQELANFSAQREFADSLARATDRNPFLQYQVAIAYFEGKVTPKNEHLGLEWMRRAAQNGSGDAKAYLASHNREIEH